MCASQFYLNASFKDLLSLSQVMLGWNDEGGYKTGEPAKNRAQEMIWGVGRMGANSISSWQPSQLCHSGSVNRALSRADLKRVLFVSPLKKPEAMTTELQDALESTRSTSRSLMLSWTGPAHTHPKGSLRQLCRCSPPRRKLCRQRGCTKAWTGPWESPDWAPSWP